jgi:hypothetical protein
MIRITSNLDTDLKVPHPTARGVKPRYFMINKRNADGTPGVTELAELDNITIERLRWHHERRPVDAKDKGNENAPHYEIGLLKIEILDGTPSPAKRTTKDEAPVATQSTSDLEPPRRDTRTAPSAPKAPAARPAKPAKPPKPRKAAA